MKGWTVSKGFAWDDRLNLWAGPLVTVVDDEGNETKVRTVSKYRPMFTLVDLTDVVKK